MEHKVMAFDIEILNAIPNRDGRREPGIGYARDWDDHKGMDIACIAVWDYCTDMPLVICKDNLETMRQMAAVYDVIVGFNTVKFDNRILAAHGIEFHPLAQQYDILREFWILDGLDPDRFDPATHGGYKLDICAQVNFGIGKSGDGATAPINWQRGKIGEVVSYCIRDVILTKRLFDIVLSGEYIGHPKTNQSVKLRHPFGWEF
jgi:hypothetical protein